MFCLFNLGFCWLQCFAIYCLCYIEVMYVVRWMFFIVLFLPMTSICFVPDLALTFCGFITVELIKLDI